MPNTLAHLGVQTLATRAAARAVELRWIALGCVIPDVPWIVRRAVEATTSAVDPFAFRLYAIAQSSLLLSLVLCGAVACLARRPRAIFAVLAGNALLHLLLDGLQAKWGNGVHLFAPFSWQIWNAGLFWPESALTVLATALGAVFLMHALLHGPRGPLLVRLAPRPLAQAGVLLLIWALAPFALMAGAEAQNNHYVQTLRDRSERTGRPLEVDRGRFRPDADGGWIRTWSGEELRALGPLPAEPGTLSVRGHFRDPETLVVDAFHVHASDLRDLASVVGLAGVAALWLAPPARRRRPARSGHEKRHARQARGG